MAKPRLQLRAVRKNYPGVRALDGVEFDARAGEVHALVGENGAGKSTLIKIVAGVVAADEGEILVDGRATAVRSAADARRSGFAFIHQELNLVEYFGAAENVFLGHPVPKRFGLFSRRRLREMTGRVFDTFGVSIPMDRPVRYLAPGQRAMVAIGRAFVHDASIYFMDEPATALTSREKERLFALIHTLREQGNTVVCVTHNLDDVFMIADRVTVLREGKRIGTWPTGEIDKDTLIAKMIGSAAQRAPEPVERTRGAVLLSVNGIAGAGVGPVSFTVRAGEVLGIGGLVGAGRSTLLQMLAGALKVRSGEITFGDRPYRPRTPGCALRKGVTLIPEERRAQGLALGLSVRANTIVSSLERFATAGLMRFSAAARAAEQAGSRARVKTASYRQVVQTLSGGNQQKVMFARALLTAPKVLLLDEPTKGVDIGARGEIYEIIRRLTGEGVGVVLVSSEFDEMLTLSDRLVFLREGRQGRTVANEGLTQHDYLRLCYMGVDDEN